MNNDRCLTCPHFEECNGTESNCSVWGNIDSGGIKNETT